MTYTPPEPIGYGSFRRGKLSSAQTEYFNVPAGQDDAVKTLFDETQIQAAYEAGAASTTHERLLAEVARLTDCLNGANIQTEEFERKWYLATDAVEALQAECETLKSKLVAPTATGQQNAIRNVTFGGRCNKHPLQIQPCKHCHAEETFKEQGICPACEGDGEQGGQFCGGYWKCEACDGTGKYTAPSES